MSEQDEELAQRARRGDVSAFEELVRRHHGAVLGLCGSLLKDATEAEDAAQEIFLKVFRSLGSFRGDARFSTWLYRIASNHCLDVLRAAARRPSTSWDKLVEERGDAADALLGRGPREDLGAEAKDLAVRLLAELPPEYRLVVILRETRGLSYEEIAEATDATLDSVKARLRRARGMLQDLLRHFSGLEDV